MSEPVARQPLQQRVAAAILEGAARMFAVEGEQASMNDVAAAAGVARATVYRYFPNRQALLDELARERVRSDPERFERRVIQPLRQLFERGQATGGIRRDIPSARLTESLIGLTVGVLTSTPPLGKEDIIATITGLFLDGARARGPRPV
jgi:TetR/AcrR family transcriptional repressor of mexCD-oprJ operon